MKFYDSVGPNPHLVRMFMAEKGLDIETVEVDLRGGENRREPFLSEVNPRGQLPVLKLENGESLTEVTVICDYLEELNPEPVLIGSTAEERANTRMWVRRCDLSIVCPMLDGYRYGEGVKFFEQRMRCIPEASDGLKAIAQDQLNWLDEQIAGRDFIAGDKFSFADIFLYCMVKFGIRVGQPLNEDNKNLAAWFERIDARPSAEA